MENRIKELRQKHHMSQIRLSIELEVSQEAVSAYENGRCYPAFQTLLKLSEIFNSSVDYIMGLTENNVKPVSLSDNENVLLNTFKKLDEIKQEKAISYIQGLYDSAN